MTSSIAFVIQPDNYASFGQSESRQMSGKRRGQRPNSQIDFQGIGDVVTCRKNRMESDIFGLGQGAVSESASAGVSQFSKRNQNQNQGPAGRPTIYRPIDWFGTSAAEETESTAPSVTGEPEVEPEVVTEDADTENNCEASAPEPEVEAETEQEPEAEPEQEPAAVAEQVNEIESNPVNDYWQGYREFEQKKSKKRQFVRPMSTKLW